MFINGKYISYVIVTFIASLSLMGRLHGQDDFNDEAQASETITVSGSVTSSQTGKGLAGANVFIEGSEDGTATDEEGNFSLENVHDKIVHFVPFRRC